MTKQPEMVEIEWVDAMSCYETYTIEEALKIIKPSNSKSIGYLMHENKKYIILARQMFYAGEQAESRHWQCIPRGMIVKINKLKRK